MAERYVPRGFIGSEQALVLIARTSHPERWRDDLLLGKEREIYERLGSSLNGEFLGDHIKVSLTKTDRESGAVMERICDFEDAAHWLRESLHAGDLVGKYLDENGDWHDIPSNRWGADDGLEALLKGITSHGLRHSFSSTAEDLGFTLPTIKALIGHSKTGNVTLGYIHKIGSALLAAADRIARHIDDAMTGRKGSKVVQLRKA